MGIKILTVLLLILKILGIVLLVILLTLLLILLLILFVPVRYQGTGYRMREDTVPVHVHLKITWLLRLVRVSFDYPEEAFLKVKILFFRLLPAKEKKKKQTEKKTASVPEETEKNTGAEKKQTAEKKQKEAVEEKEAADREAANEKETADREAAAREEKRSLPDFIRKLIRAVKNIKYTIRRIYDKIKHILRNIRYYVRILQTESFQRAFVLCTGQLKKLVKMILPRKMSAVFTIGMEDPAVTGQILSAYGILYPMLGDKIKIIPDFEEPIVEGVFNFKGKITAFTLIRVAAKIYFDKDLKRVIRLFKKEAVQNGRK